MSELCQKMNSVLNEYIRPLTFPVAVKIISDDTPLPAKTKVPTENLKYPLAFCQGVTMARKYGWTLGFYQKDQACPISQVILGYVDEPDFIKDGSLVHPLYVETMEAAAKTQSATPKMAAANTKCIVIAPLHTATFDPDVVIVYGNAAQIVRMVQGALYKEGGAIESKFAGRGACGGEVTVPFTQQKCNVILPGGGERVFALTQDDELAFAMPKSKFDSVMEGVVATHKGGVARIPTPVFGVNVKPQFPKYYWELEKYCGLRD